MILDAKYSAVSYDGTTVVVPTEMTGATEERELQEGDIFLAITDIAQVDNNSVIAAAKGDRMVIQDGVAVRHPKQPEPGDIVILTCDLTDNSFLAGQMGVVSDLGYLRGSWAGFASWLLQQSPPG